MLETFMKLNSSRAGHDKLIRTLQYTCKLMAASGCENSDNYDYLARLTGAARKFLRLGTCIDSLYASFSIPMHLDTLSSLTVTFSRIANTMYLFCDHLIWCHSTNFIKIDKKYWDNLSDRCWMYSIIMDLVRDIYSINNIVSKMHFISSTPAYVYLLQNHKNLVVDTLKNVSDLVLPLSTLGIVNKVLKRFLL